MTSEVEDLVMDNATCMLVIARLEIIKLRRHRKIAVGVAIVLLCSTLWLAMTPAHAQDINRVVTIAPGTSLAITQNGETVISQSVRPGTVQIIIRYLAHDRSMDNRRPHGVRKR